MQLRATGSSTSGSNDEDRNTGRSKFLECLCNFGKKKSMVPAVKASSIDSSVVPVKKSSFVTGAWKRLSSTLVNKRNLPSSDSSSSDDETTASTAVNFPQLYGGILVFRSDVSDSFKENYVIIDKETSLEDLGLFMTKFWQLPAPKVVLSVISNYNYFIRPNDSDIDDFQIGLIQAARLTNMWILTEGLNTGLPLIIGEAVAQERVRRKIMENVYNADHAIAADQLVVIGVVASNDLNYGEDIEKEMCTVEQNKKLFLHNRGVDERNLNAQHTHCIILRGTEQYDIEAQWNARFNVESKLVQYVHKRRLMKMQKVASAGGLRQSQQQVLAEKLATHSPVVGLLCQGGPSEIERVLWFLKKQIPVIVIAKRRQASGLLAYAYFEGVRGSDSQHLENIVKPQLMHQVLEAFPDFCSGNETGRIQCRDKILECVKYAVQENCRFLTIVDPSHSGVDLKDLNKHILTAIINSQRGALDFHSREKVNWNLRLCLDWNTPDFASTQIFDAMDRTQFRVKDELFMEALLLPDREQFIELFLDMGFILNRFLILDRFVHLFEYSFQNEFFISVCLEKILHIKSGSVPPKFLDGPNCQLNRLLSCLTGLKQLVNPTQISLAHVHQKPADIQVAERKALLALIYWAVLINKQGLVKVLWKRTAEPIAVALVISNIYYRMSKFWITDIDLRAKMKQNAIDFGTLAIQMMDVTYNDSRVMAFHSLTIPNSDFNNLNVVDLAYMGKNIFFIAHPCCQRSIRERWLGNIKIKSFSTFWFPMPEFMKLYMCLFLVIPMYFWITFDAKRKSKVQWQEIFEISEKDENQSSSISSDLDIDEIKELILKKTPYLGDDPYAKPPIWKKLYYMWTAPVSKFWINQLFIVIYLCLFAACLMYPFCGMNNCNLVLCTWTLIILIEHFMRIIWKKRKYSTLNMFWNLADLANEVLIVGVLTVLNLQHNNVLPPQIPAQTYTTYKFLLSIGLIFTYYRALRYMLPVSPDLGPMLVNINQLTRKDLIKWISLWMFCLVPGGLAIHIAIYPVKEMTLPVLLKTLMRSALGIFLTEISDLEGDPTCTPMYGLPEISNTCNAYVLHRLANCPHASIFGYLIVIQLLLATRQIFYVLMFSMFSVTTNRTKERSVEIWKFQFYSIVTDFERRPVVPVPLTPITYPFRIVYFILRLLLKALFRCSACCTHRPLSNVGRKYAQVIPYSALKSYITTVEKTQEDTGNKIEDILTELEEGSTGQKTMTKRLNDRLANIEKNQILTLFLLESLINNLKNLDPNKQGQSIQSKQTHLASRQSPYPGTDIQRFPVLENQVPWEIRFEAYDPVSYTKPSQDFPQELQMWLDVNILELPVQAQHEEFKVSDVTAEGAKMAFIYPEFNAIQAVTLPTGSMANINRMSYMTTNDRALIYDIDVTGVPRNPMGRTGVRGRGCLWRWGPNHVIQVVISRWATGPMTTSVVQSSDAGKGRPLEVLVLKEGADSVSLPGGKVLGDKSPYSVICEFIVKEVFKEEDLEVGPTFDQDMMIEWFSQFASADLTKKKKTIYANLGYSGFLVYRGYADDPANTDNAWKETEIWNFHYKNKECFEIRYKELDQAMWMVVTSQMPMFPSELTAVIESAKIHDAFY